MSQVVLFDLFSSRFARAPHRSNRSVLFGRVLRTLLILSHCEGDLIRRVRPRSLFTREASQFVSLIVGAGTYRFHRPCRGKGGSAFDIATSSVASSLYFKRFLSLVETACGGIAHVGKTYIQFLRSKASFVGFCFAKRRISRPSGESLSRM